MPAFSGEKCGPAGAHRGDRGRDGRLDPGRQDPLSRPFRGGPDTIRRAAAVHPIAALQTEYSLWTQDIEAQILPLCRELGIGYVAYSPLGRGYLTATIRTPDDLIEKDRRHDHPRFHADSMARNCALLDSLARILPE